MSIRDKLLPRLNTIPAKMGAFLAMSYVLPVTVLSNWTGATINQAFIYGSRVVLIVGLIYLARQKKINANNLAIVALTLPGVIFSRNMSQSFVDWAGWSILFLVVGPFFLNNHAVVLRKVAWDTIRFFLIVIGIASFFWYTSGLPNLGRGLFTGVMKHSMLLGPMAGMGFLFAFNYALNNKSKLFALVSFLLVVPCLLAGSRSAVLALVAGFIVLFGLYLDRIGRGRAASKIVLVIFLSFFGFTAYESVNKSYLYEVTGTLAKKGMVNTRDILWDARWKEFTRSPVFGIGIGMGEEGPGVLMSEEGAINVEPGSSYLSVLSMSGLAGALGLTMVLMNLFFRVRRNHYLKLSDPVLSEDLFICAFMAVHMTAEGYIYAVGSPFCFLFWLCLGRVQDISSAWPSQQAFMRIQGAGT